jgi:hypothetical protein
MSFPVAFIFALIGVTGVGVFKRFDCFADPSVYTLGY